MYSTNPNYVGRHAYLRVATSVYNDEDVIKMNNEFKRPICKKELNHILKNPTRYKNDFAKNYLYEKIAELEFIPGISEEAR